MKFPVGGFRSMKRGDRALLAAFAALLAVVLALYVYLRSVPGGAIITVSAGGEIVDVLRLNETREPFRRTYGTADGFNTIYADSGGASVVEADCPDRRCVRKGRVTKEGESVVCLPHRFILSVTGEGKSEPDGGPVK